jgi:hypothetical protein
MNPMTEQEALDLFLKIRSEYDSIPFPKYRNANLNDLKKKYEVLKELKVHLKDNMAYARLENSFLQTIKRLSPSGDWRNVSERGINKSIPPVIKKGGKAETNIHFPFEWEDKHSKKLCSITGYWNARHLMAMDVISYCFLLKTGGNSLPKEVSPIFEDIESIKLREMELKPFLDKSPIPSEVTEEDIPIIKNQKYWVKLSDKDFRRFTGKEMSSNEIMNLLRETSSVEFCLSFPVRLFRGDRKDAKERWYDMTIFSRLFELASINIDVRKDGVVQGREYYIVFSTILGELFVHNLLTFNFDWVDKKLYNLPRSAQIFYRHFLLHNNFSSIQLNLDTIVSEMNFLDKNITNLIKNLELNTLEPLKRNGLILSYKETEGLQGIKYEIKRPNKKKPDLSKASDKNDTNEEDEGIGK